MLSIRPIVFCTVVFFFFFVRASVSFALSDPRAFPNNQYGIHILDENDLETAAFLVNSSGGDWGYVTIPLPEAERNTEKWNRIFLRMRRLHLIPIVRIATRLVSDTWVAPEEADAGAWADFLSSLSWVTENRYVILFNEPNHAKEWGGRINPEEYARVLIAFSQALKGRSDDFFILPAGMDAAAPDSSMTMDEARFLSRMHRASGDVFSFLDGWTSHAYPNPGFVGTLADQGRLSLSAYTWELSLLSTLGVATDFPVFITETGWPHREGDGENRSFYSADAVSLLITSASERVWSDDAISAVTPFLLNYQSMPFSHFSWTKHEGGGFYPQFDAYRSIPKTAGAPPLAFSLSPTPMPSPPVLGVSSQTAVPTRSAWETLRHFIACGFSRISHFFSGVVSSDPAC